MGRQSILEGFLVSIHAPARGATFDMFLNAIPNTFQSTRPRGARRQSRNIRIIVDSFNPRAREGRDVSIHN